VSDFLSGGPAVATVCRRRESDACCWWASRSWIMRTHVSSYCRSLAGVRRYRENKVAFEAMVNVLQVPCWASRASCCSRASSSLPSPSWSCSEFTLSCSCCASRASPSRCCSEHLSWSANWADCVSSSPSRGGSWFTTCAATIREVHTHHESCAVAAVPGSARRGPHTLQRA
jgi:hypothetical protein